MSSKFKIHSYLTSRLPTNHPLAYDTVCCDLCHEIIHWDNNDDLTTWVEADTGNDCLQCFADRTLPYLAMKTR